MTNHVHLLLTPRGTQCCALLMKHLGQLHSQYFNKLYQRTGSLWEGRFRSCLVQSERYLLTCYCYIELNPVRAGLVAHPRDYRWSSYGENAAGSPTGLIKPHAEYLRLGPNVEERQQAYAGLFGSYADAQLIEEIRSATNGGYAFGDVQFRAATARALGRRVERGRPGRPSRGTENGASQEELPLSSAENVVCP